MAKQQTVHIIFVDYSHNNWEVYEIFEDYKEAEERMDELVYGYEDFRLQSFCVIPK